MKRGVIGLVIVVVSVCAAQSASFAKAHRDVLCALNVAATLSPGMSSVPSSQTLTITHGGCGSLGGPSAVTVSGTLKIATTDCDTPNPALTGSLTFAWTGLPASTVKLNSNFGYFRGSPYTFPFAGKVRAGSFTGDKVVGDVAIYTFGADCDTQPVTTIQLQTQADGGKNLRFQHPTK
jgi:hypothetical protein